MTSQKIKGTAIVKSVKYEGGGKLVLENFQCEKENGLLKRLANAKAKKKELVTVTIEPVQKTLIKEE